MGFEKFKTLLKCGKSRETGESKNPIKMLIKIQAKRLAMSKVKGA